MGATAAHKTSERVVDGTCIQVWVWMTNKCRRRMNQEEGYITLEISQKKKKGGLLGSQRIWEFTFSDEESFSPMVQGRLILCS